MIEWNLWTSLPTLKLWEAVALVFEVNPRTLSRRLNALKEEPQFSDRGFSNRVQHGDFERALYFASRSANRDEGPIIVQRFQGSASRRIDADVLLSEVVSYFTTIGWPSIPTELQRYHEHRIATQPSNSAVNELKTRERNSLLRIIYGMAIQGYKYNPDEVRNNATAEIANDCEISGCPIDADTVRKYLDEAKKQFGSTKR